MIAIALNKNISCDYICKKIEQLVRLHQEDNNLENSILTINITTSTDSPISQGVYLIEHKCNT